MVRSLGLAVLTLGLAVALSPGLACAGDARQPMLWVVEGDELVEREVEILGREGNELVVRTFDTADGVVAIPPPEVRAGLRVEPVFTAEFASSGAVAGAAK